MTKGLSYVAEILASVGHNVTSYPQIWVSRNSNIRIQLILTDTPQAARVLNNGPMHLLNAFETKNTTDAIDDIILLECWGINVLKESLLTQCGASVCSEILSAHLSTNVCSIF